MTTETKPSPVAKWRRRNPIMLWVERTGQPYGWLGRMAEDIGVSRQAIYRWLIGDTSPQARHLDELAKLTRGIVNYNDWRRWLRAKPS
jgi:hypothetical protein